MRASYCFCSSILILASLAGCGGGSSTVAKDGQAVFKVVWPSRTRLIPSAANSITATLILNGSVVTSQTIARPPSGTNTTQTTFTGLAYGTYTTNVQAFPSTDGSGIAQAVGTATMAVGDGSPGSVTVDMTSTVTALSLSPASITIPKLGTANLTVSATDANGNVVLLSAGGGTEPIVWTVDDPNLISLSGTGTSVTLTANHSGSTNVHASFVINDSGSTVSTSAPITITPIYDGSGTVNIQ